jgi:hypothetical protein
MSNEIDHDLLEAHRMAAINMREWKAKELALRVEITDQLLEGQDIGTHNFILHGMFVKAVKGVSYSLDKNVIDEKYDEMSDDERGLIRWKPELKLGDYKSAVFDTDILEEALTIKPSLPTLDITLGK